MIFKNIFQWNYLDIKMTYKFLIKKIVKIFNDCNIFVAI
jgi:hypothetical protein